SACRLSDRSYLLSSLPGALGHACDVAFERQLAETEAAHRELAHEGAGPAAQLAAVPQANLVFRGLRFLRDLCCRCHIVLSSWCGTACPSAGAASAPLRRFSP